MTRQLLNTFWRMAGFTAIILLVSSAPVLGGTVIPSGKDVDGTRTKFNNDEGYLSFHFVYEPFGEERTGWTDIRHPAYFDGGAANPFTIKTTDTKLGYDRSDHMVMVNNVIVEDQNGVKPAATKDTIARDFDYANQIYAQLGVCVLNEGIKQAKYNNVTYPVSYGAEDANIRAANRSANALTINTYYIKDFNDGAFGLTRSPEDFSTPATLLADGSRADTAAHEQGHFHLDHYRFNNPTAEAWHSPNDTDLMATGSIRKIPNANIKKNDSPKYVNTAPSHPGRTVGNIGGVDRFDANAGPAGGPYNIPQIDAIYAAASDGKRYIQCDDNGLTHGDIADFDWVEDNIAIEQTSKSITSMYPDNHPGADWLVWEIGTIAHSLHDPDHNHGDWGELDLPGYDDDTFRMIDVISQICRYTDMDVDPTSKNWSPRESALDYYIPEFSFDQKTWEEGTLIKVFKDGWTLKSEADDFVARFKSPIKAKYVRIKACALGGIFDGNVQIDAIIAAVPEPSSAVLLLMGLSCVWAVRRRSCKTLGP